MRTVTHLYTGAPSGGRPARPFTLFGVAIDAARHAHRGESQPGLQDNARHVASPSRPSPPIRHGGGHNAFRPLDAAKSGWPVQAPADFCSEPLARVLAKSVFGPGMSSASARTHHIYKARV